MFDLTNIYRLMSRLRRVTDNGDEQADIRQKCSVSYVTCIVDESWIERIEQGMNFVGKAIDEERRFIRVNGEVQPIEKVRKVSKESVQHLARHSDLITHEQRLCNVRKQISVSPSRYDKRLYRDALRGHSQGDGRVCRQIERRGAPFAA